MLQVNFPTDADPANSLLTKRLIAETEIEPAQSFESQLQERRKIQKQLTERRQSKEEQQFAIGQKLAAASGNEANQLNSTNEVISDSTATNSKLQDPLSFNLASAHESPNSITGSPSNNRNSVLTAEAPRDPAALLIQFQATIKQAAAAIQQGSDDTQFTQDLKLSNSATNENVSAPVSKEATVPTKEAVAVQVRIPIPLDSPEWQQAISQQMAWIANNQMTAAEIHLNPPELGPISARLKLLADKKVQVVFLSEHQLVRTALAEALPQLSDLFLSQGLSLGKAEVQDQSNDHQAVQSFAEFAGSNNKIAGSAYVINQRNGLLDYYA